MAKNLSEKEMQTRKRDVTLLFDYKIFTERLNCLRMDEENSKEAEKNQYSFERLSKAIKEKTGVDITAQQLSKYEDYDKCPIPTINNLLAIADFFNVSVDYLIGRSDSKELGAVEKLMNKKYKLSDKAMENLAKWKNSDSKFQNFSKFKILQKIMEDEEFLNDLTTYFCKHFDLYPPFSGIKTPQELKIETRNIISSLNVVFEEFVERTYNSLVEKPSFDRRLIKSSPYPKWKAYNFREDNQA